MRIDKAGYPMMAEREIKFIEDLINKNKFQTCLEWGSGNSTIWFPNKCESIKSWVSIEHNGHYVNYLKDQVKKDVVQLNWIQDDKLGYVWPFLRSPDQITEDKKFDFIFIDGLYRDECLASAMKVIKPDGVILVHDTGRIDYQVWIEKYPNREKIFDGEIPVKEGGFAHRGLTLFKA